MTEERDKIPYPIDESLIQEAQMIGNGRWTHDLNRAIGNYRSAAKRWGGQWTAYLWYDAVKAERELRGIVTEAKIGKNFHAPWAER